MDFPGFFQDFPGFFQISGGFLPHFVHLFALQTGALRRGAWPKSGDVVASLQLLNFDLDTWRGEGLPNLVMTFT